MEAIPRFLVAALLVGTALSAPSAQASEDVTIPLRCTVVWVDTEDAGVFAIAWPEPVQDAAAIRGGELPQDAATPQAAGARVQPDTCLQPIEDFCREQGIPCCREPHEQDPEKPPEGSEPGGDVDPCHPSAMWGDHTYMVGQSIGGVAVCIIVTLDDDLVDAAVKMADCGVP